jgi:ABC-type uncharacterized transport system substrate-binding protein
MILRDPPSRIRASAIRTARAIGFVANRAELRLLAATPRIRPAFTTTGPTALRRDRRLSYGPDPLDISRRAASYVDRILRGEKPGDLPVQLPTKFEMVVNRKTATALGLAIPPSIMLRADEVIE